MPILQAENLDYLEEELGAPFYINGEGYNDVLVAIGTLTSGGEISKMIFTVVGGALEFVGKITKLFRGTIKEGTLVFASLLPRKPLIIVEGILNFIGIPDMIQEIFYRLKAAIGITMSPVEDIIMAHRQPSSDGHALTASIEIDGTLASTL